MSLNPSDCKHTEHKFTIGNLNISITFSFALDENFCFHNANEITKPKA